MRAGLVQLEGEQQARARRQLAVGLVDQILEAQRLEIDDGERNGGYLCGNAGDQLGFKQIQSE